MLSKGMLKNRAKMPNKKNPDFKKHGISLCYWEFTLMLLACQESATNIYNHSIHKIYRNFSFKDTTIHIAQPNLAFPTSPYIYPCIPLFHLLATGPIFFDIMFDHLLMLLCYCGISFAISYLVIQTIGET